MVYAYVAYNESKEIVKGKLEARNEEQAAQLLDYAGYQLINLREMVRFQTLEKIILRLSPIKPTDIILFYRQMALLIESGLNIVSAIELLEEQATNRIFKRVMGEIIADVRSGSQMSAALAKHPQIFTPIHCQSLKVGEQTGGMEVILRQMADHMEKQVNAGKGVKNAMTYPVIASIVALIVVGIMVTFVLPAFSGLYASLNVPMPLLTRLMLDLGADLRAYGIYLLGALVIAGIVGYAYLRTAAGRYKWDELSLKFPIVGRINHLNELARFSRSVAVLFKAGSSLTRDFTPGYPEQRQQSACPGPSSAFATICWAGKGCPGRWPSIRSFYRCWCRWSEWEKRPATWTPLCSRSPRATRPKPRTRLKP